ncbi:sialic acid-binding Ig-like lectin 13 [Anomaloglossus baeobatrachus]|uniref:sialic acid-binding Ig-like lectin 13 n=1 Tax=Anomaloglossus baeobatrachus TaxID=238106 RepID=UPI003F509D4D
MLHQSLEGAVTNNGCDCQAEDYTINSPHKVTAQVGLCVYIPCTFTIDRSKVINSTAKGFWFYGDPGQPNNMEVASSQDPSKPMFFTGKISERDCSLLMNDIQKSDENSYYFRFEDITIQYNYVIPNNHRTSLTVTDLTDKPEISVGTLVAGKVATATCRSPGVCAGTAPGFTWTGLVGSSSNYNNPYPNRTSVYFSDFTFTPSRKDNGRALVCRVNFQRNTAVTSQTINLNVQYPPEVNITIRDSPDVNITIAGGSELTLFVKEGKSSEINCTVDSNPIAEITWSVRNEKKKAINGQWLSYNLTNISISDAGKYLCTGKNHLGISKSTIDIIVHYAPRTPNINCKTTEDCSISEEQMAYIMEDTTITLVCTAKSLPESSLSWIPSSSSTKYTAVEGYLTINKVAHSDEGQFTCVANNSYGMSNSSIIIKVTTQPKNYTGIIIAVVCVIVIALLFIGGVIFVIYLRKKKLSKNSKNKEMNANDSSVIYANSEVHVPGNQTEDIGTNSVAKPENNSVYMNVDDIHYASVDFSKLKPTNAQKNTEIVYAEIKR